MRDILYRGALRGLTAVLTFIFIGYMIGIVHACHNPPTRAFERTEAVR